MPATRLFVLALAALITMPILVVQSSAAAAQPGEWRPAPAPPPRTIVLTPAEQKILARGEVSTSEHIAGGLLGTFIGFGTGHLAQGRWSETGWMFTLGEGLSSALWITALTSCSLADLEGRAREDRCIASMVGGMLVYAGLRVWELADVWTQPQKHNNRVRELRLRTGQFRPRYGVFAVPTTSSSGVAGLAIQF